jgi:hypothetical protein
LVDPAARQLLDPGAGNLLDGHAARGFLYRSIPDRVKDFEDPPAPTL